MHSSINMLHTQINKIHGPIECWKHFYQLLPKDSYTDINLSNFCLLLPVIVFRCWYKQCLEQLECLKTTMIVLVTVIYGRQGGKASLSAWAKLVLVAPLLADNVYTWGHRYVCKLLNCFPRAVISGYHMQEIAIFTG